MESLIDSSVLIEIERGRIDLEALLVRAGDGAAISVVTAAEVLHGVDRLSTSRRKAQASTRFEALLARVAVIPFDLVCARTYAQVGADLASRGITVGIHDLMIGVTALTRGMRIITRDRRSFPRVRGLEVELLG